MIEACYFAASLGTYLVQHSALAGVLNVPLNVLYLLVLVGLVGTGRRDRAVVHCLMYFLVFHQYAANPYDPAFVNYIGGPFKFVYLVVCLAILRPVVGRKRVKLLYGVAVLAVVTAQLRGAENFTPYILTDVLVYTLLLGFALIAGAPLGRDYAGIVRKSVLNFAGWLPVAYIVIAVAGISSRIGGSTYFFFGHLYALVVVYSAWETWRPTVGKTGSWMKAASIINVAAFVPVAQTEHLVIIAILFLLEARRHSRVAVVFRLAVFAGLVATVAARAQPGSWVQLKYGQAVALATGGMRASNSAAVRGAELAAIADANGIVEHILGNGLGATYRPQAHFRYLNLHAATFPEDQLQTGEFYLIHVGMVKLYFNLGLLGLLAVTAVIGSSIWFAARRGVAGVVPAVFFFFFWSASIQAVFFSLLLGAITLGVRRPNGVEREPQAYA